MAGRRVSCYTEPAPIKGGYQPPVTSAVARGWPALTARYHFVPGHITSVP
jgi:hypothetical protein